MCCITDIIYYCFIVVSMNIIQQYSSDIMGQSLYNIISYSPDWQIIGFSVELY